MLRRTWAGERGSNALTIGEASAAEADVVCCNICSSCTRLADVRPRRCKPTGLQLEHGQLFGNGLRSDLELSSAEVTTKPDPDGRLLRRPEPRPSADLRRIATKPQITTYLGLDHVSPRSPRARVGPRPAKGVGRNSTCPRSHPWLGRAPDGARRELRQVSEFLCTP